jgi:hypothetical protein
LSAYQPGLDPHTILALRDVFDNIKRKLNELRS